MHPGNLSSLRSGTAAPRNRRHLSPACIGVAAAPCYGEQASAPCEVAAGSYLGALGQRLAGLRVDDAHLHE